MHLMGFAALAAAAGVAGAGSFAWEWNGVGGDNRGGAMSAISASYDHTTEVFCWDVTYSNQITEGFTLAVSDGPNPKGTRGELALIYFDADSNGDNSIGDVNVTAYEYSGQNNSQSWNNPGVLLNQSGDANFIIDASATDNVDGTRTFSLKFDASTINAYAAPPVPGTDWFGIGFENLIGVWFHSFKNLTTNYNSEGELTQWSGTDGWLDFSDRNATFIPMPLAGAMGCAGLGLVMTRRRR